MAAIAALDAGTYYHKESLTGDRYRRFFAGLIYAPELPQADLSPYDALIVTDRVNPRLLRQARDKIASFLALGRTLVVMGETRPDTWLDGVRWSYRPTNYWWWLEKGAALGLTTAAPDHSLFRFLTLHEATWHYHGVFHPPAGAVPVIELEHGGGVLLYDDRVSVPPGRLLITCLDPFYHHGSHFMPATTRFLDRFLPWLQAEIGPEAAR